MSNLLMISGDRSLAEGKHGAFYNTLEELHKHFEKIDVICPKIRNSKLGIRNFFDNVEVHPSPWPLILQPFWILRAGLRILKTNNYKLETRNYLMTVHEYPPFYNGLGAWFLSCKTSIPYMLEIMHIPGLPKSGSLKEFIYKYLAKLFIRFDAKFAKIVRVINKRQTKDFLIKHGVSEEKIKYIHANYIDLDVFKKSNEEKIYDLVFAARIEKNKGIINLIEALHIIKKQGSEIRLIIVGNGSELKNIKSKIKLYNFEDSVYFSGWLDGPKDVAKVYQQSRVFINPSFNEGGPRVAIEAMACGLPVITTQVGIMVDIIKDGENGFFCGWEPKEIANSILKVFSDNRKQENVAEEGFKTAQKFEYHQAVAEYVQAIKTL